jgi:hypothetical protein
MTNNKTLVEWIDMITSYKKQVMIDKIHQLQKTNNCLEHLHLKMLNLDDLSIFTLETYYWCWTVFHFSCNPCADTGDLYLTDGDFLSSNVDELLQSIELLKEVKEFCLYYKVTSPQELNCLMMLSD